MLSDLRLYVHDVRVLTTAGDALALRLRGDGAFQGDQVALLDFEDGSGPCRNGTPALHTRLVGTLPQRAEAAALRLRVGVPEELNHQNPDRAAPPLSVPALQWGWSGPAWDIHAYVDGLGDLDKCNGLPITEAGAPFDYAYFATDSFPYFLGCYHGTPTSNR